MGTQDQGSLSASRTSSEIDASQRKHQLVSGALGRFGQRRQKPQELTALGEAHFGIVGEKPEVTHAHEAFGDHVE